MSEQQSNYDETLVPEYTLPDPLVMDDGTPVTDSGMWTQHRRPELLRLFEEHVYGRSPGVSEMVRYDVFDDTSDALGGTAIRRQVRLLFRNNGHRHSADLLLYLPADADGPVPIFLGLNFYGNHTIWPDPDIRLSGGWMRENDDFGVVDNRATEVSRGAASKKWPVSRILERGYGLATLYYGDFDPDFDDGFQNGVHPLFYAEGQTEPAPDEWASIGAWAWGLSRAVDYLETDADVDDTRIAVMGLSRLAKTALWAGAQDERMAFVISCESGCGGAALARRRFGETVSAITTKFPHWFCGNHTQYGYREEEMPVDQHELIALMAPRPVYVCSATKDEWSDPRGEFLAAKAADSVYRLLGTEGMAADEMPDPMHPVTSTIGYHIRYGTHSVASYDWECWMDTADRHLR
jgi:hypothetical protein